MDCGSASTPVKLKWYTYVKMTPNGVPFYVGKGCGPRAYVSYGRTPAYLKILKKYGEKNIQTNVVFYATEKEAIQHERMLISQYKKENISLVNQAPGWKRWTSRKKDKNFFYKEDLVRLFHKYLGITMLENGVYFYIYTKEFPNNTGWGCPRKWEKEPVLEWFKKRA